MTRAQWLGLVLAAAGASGCGLKGPLFLPDKSDVTIRPAPPPSAPTAPTEPPATGEPSPQPAPAPPPEPPARVPPGGQARG